MNPHAAERDDSGSIRLDDRDKLHVDRADSVLVGLRVQRPSCSVETATRCEHAVRAAAATRSAS